MRYQAALRPDRQARGAGLEARLYGGVWANASGLMAIASGEGTIARCAHRAMVLTARLVLQSCVPIFAAAGKFRGNTYGLAHA
jgi:hypothetical protein